jgi:hypothetical protein
MAASNGDKLLGYFLLPPPVDAAYWNTTQDILTEYCWWEFDGAALPEIRFEGSSRTVQ